MQEATAAVEGCFNDICFDLNVSNKQKDQMWDKILLHYNEPQRHYHTMTHIEDLMTKLSQYSAKIQDQIVVQLAILYHDIIYDPLSKTNEEDSAKYFEIAFEDILSDHQGGRDMLRKVKYYILATKHHDQKIHEEEDISDLQLFLDFDLSILGSSSERYDAYSQQIRQEYSTFPDKDYCTGRLKVLRGILNNGECIYCSDIFRSAYEAQARLNIDRECKALEQQLQQLGVN